MNHSLYNNYVAAFVVLVSVFVVIPASPLSHHQNLVDFGGPTDFVGNSNELPMIPPNSGVSLFTPHRLMKRSFFDMQCKGVYDKSIFARLDRICEDCYSLFREPQLHTLCKKDCFTSDYFKGCLEALQLQDEMESIQANIKQLHGADPNV